MLKQKKFHTKKFKLFLLLTLLTLGFVTASILIIATITGANIKAIKGATEVSYPLYLDNDEAVAGFQTVVNYSTEDLTLKEIQPTNRLPDATIITNDISPILNIAVLANNENSKISPGEGAVLNLIFDISESAMPNNYTIEFSNTIIANISAVALESQTIPGNFEIIDPYNFEFLPPVTNFENFTLQNGATLPLKFYTRDNNNNFIKDTSVLVRIFNLSLGIDHTYNASGTGNEYITIDETESQYITNIHTGTNGLDMPIGLYMIEVTFNNYQKEKINFELVDKSNGIGKGKKK